MTALNFHYERNDLVEAARAHVRAIRRKPWITLLMILAYSIFVAWLFDDWSEGIDVRRTLITVVGTMAAMAVLLILIRTWAHYWWIPRNIARNFALQRDLHGQISVSWDAIALTAESETGKSTRPFSHWAFWLENAGMVMAYQSEIIYFVIPERAFSDDLQRNELIASFERAGIKRR